MNNIYLRLTSHIENIISLDIIELENLKMYDILHIHITDKHKHKLLGYKYELLGYMSNGKYITVRNISFGETTLSYIKIVGGAIDITKTVIRSLKMKRIINNE